MSDKSSGRSSNGQLSKNGRPTLDEKIVILKEELVNRSYFDPYHQIRAEVIASGVFLDDKLEGKGKPIPDIRDLVFSISSILAESSPQFRQETYLSPDFDNAWAKLSKIKVTCSCMEIGEKEADDLLERLRKLRDKVFKKIQLNYRFDTDFLILIISDYLNEFKIRTSDRSLARCIDRLLKIPSVNNQMITDEAIRKRISNLRKIGKIP